MVDTDGRALKLQAHPADIQDRDGGRALLRASRRSLALRRNSASPMAAMPGSAWPTPPASPIEIVRKPDDQVGFAVHRPPLGRRALLRLDQP